MPSLTSDLARRRAIAHFAAKLRFETDASDVHTALESGRPVLALIDTRNDVAWQQGRIPGAVHLPTREIEERAATLLDPHMPVVTYCWGPGCNGATRAALKFAELGYDVKEMIGGYEYWSREGLPVESDSGVRRDPTDPLTGPVGAARCEC